MLWVALFSAFCRGGVNLIDRYLLGMKTKDLFINALFNVALPFLLCLVITLAFFPAEKFLDQFLQPGPWIFALAIQLASYSFSYAFKHMEITRVMVLSKIGEVLIPISLFPITGAWSEREYLFYAASLLAFSPLFIRNGNFFKQIPWISLGTIAFALNFQAIVFAFLPKEEGHTVESFWLLNNAILGCRVIYSFIPLLFKARHPGVWLVEIIATMNLPMTLIRTFAFLFTQGAFLLALGQPHSYLTWPILNCTPLIASLGGYFILKEELRKSEISALCLLTIVLIWIK